MLVRLLAGSRAGSVADIPLPNARVMLADGRAELVDGPGVATPPAVDPVVLSPARRDDRRADGSKQRRTR